MENLLYHEKNWFMPSLDKDIILYKKSVMEALDITANSFQSYGMKNFSYLFKDIDILSFCFSRYLFQNSSILSHKDVVNHLQQQDKAHFILKNGCVPSVALFILKNHPSLVQDEELSFSVLKSYQRDQEILNLYQTILEQPDFVKKLLKKNIVFPKLLTIYPYDLKISRLLVKQGYLPYYNKQYQYSKKLYNDVRFVKKILAGHNGDRFYQSLPENLQNNQDICQYVLQHHPNATVKFNGLDNIESFRKFVSGASPFCNELYTVIKKANETSIFNDIDNIIQLFSLINEKKMTCYVDLMGDPQFKSHPIQEFLREKSQKIPLLKDFLDSSNGQEIITYQVSNYSDFDNFEKSILPTIKDKIDKFYHYNYLEQSLSINCTTLINKTKI